MKLLAFDTATASCSAAVWCDGVVLAERCHAMERGHSEALVPMIAAVMDEAGLAFAELDGIAVTVGPGAFTGVRIGLATARALSLAANLPCLGVTTLEAVAADVQAENDVVVVLDAKRNDVYAQTFSPALQPLEEPAAILPEALAARLAGNAAVTLAGDGCELVTPVLEAAGVVFAVAPPRRPRAPVVARIAASRRQLRSPPPRPLYLRAPDVTLPKTA